jgi:hypothetical protein
VFATKAIVGISSGHIQRLSSQEVNRARVHSVLAATIGNRIFKGTTWRSSKVALLEDPADEDRGGSMIV